MSRRVFLYLLLFCASLTKGWAQESFTLNVGSTGYATLYFDKALSFESFGNDLKAYGVAYVTNGKVTLSRVGVVPPKIGVVVKATQPGTYNIPIVESQDVLVSLMKGVLEDTEITATQPRAQQGQPGGGLLSCGSGGRYPRGQQGVSAGQVIGPAGQCREHGVRR